VAGLCSVYAVLTVVQRDRSWHTAACGSPRDRDLVLAGITALSASANSLYERLAGSAAHPASLGAAQDAWMALVAWWETDTLFGLGFGGGATELTPQKWDAAPNLENEYLRFLPGQRVVWPALWSHLWCTQQESDPPSVFGDARLTRSAEHRVP
jgi:hypothetical protein